VVPKVVVELVEELKEMMPIGEICRHLGVARSSYYRWKVDKNKLTHKNLRGQQIYRKIAELLIGIGEKTVQRVMQKYGWQCRIKVKKRKRTGQPAQLAL